jgi:hypothetical protein
VDGYSSSRAKAVFSSMFTKAQKAHHMLRRRCHVMEIYNIDILTHLFVSLVQPILNFGCEVWAPSILNNIHITNDHACEKWHRGILKQMLGVCQSTTSNIIMEELGRTPVCFAWLKQTLRFWNKIIDKEPEDLIRMALEESFDSNTGWVHDLHDFILRLPVTGFLTSVVSSSLQEDLYNNDELSPLVCLLPLPLSLLSPHIADFCIFFSDLYLVTSLHGSQDGSNLKGCSPSLAVT